MPVGYDGNALVIGSESQRTHPNFIWNAVLGGKQPRKFQLVNKGLKVVCVLNGIRTWSAIAYNTVLEPPLVYHPVAIANGQTTFDETTQVWNVEGNVYTAGTRLCLYGQQHQTSATTNEVFVFADTGYKNHFTSNTYNAIGQIFEHQSHFKQVGDVIKVFKTVADAIAAF